MSARSLQPADIRPLSEALALLPLMQRYNRPANAIAESLESALARGDGLLVFDDGNGAQGLSWFLFSGTFGLGGYLRLMAVSPYAHRKGIGSELLIAYEAAVATQSRHTFLLCSDFNVDAQRFYERHGYVQVGRLPSLVVFGVDELVYWKRLATI
ncbi:MAG: GNAT family N-acetyltransferase [Deltaproteobacteria bacterium]|nr:GNAT family N-acetyltransferase [Deltaproteobacteria bacterium]